MPQLSDVARVNDRNLSDEEFSSVFNRARVLEALEAVESSNGTQHKYLVETSAPTVGFRPVNVGRANGYPGEETRTVDLKLLDASFHNDIALCRAFRNGEAAWLERQVPKYLRAGLFLAEGAIINGDAEGFNGMHQAVTVATTPKAIVHAGGGEGTDEDPAESVYLVNSADDGFSVVTNGDFVIDEAYLTTIATAANGGANVATFDAWRVPITSWMSVQLGAAFDIIRIAGINKANPLTDALIYEAAALAPASKSPNLAIMTKRTQEMLRNSRVATTTDGRAVPTPDTVPGVGRIVLTDTTPLSIAQPTT